ncbi:MAG: hypothetical protein ACR5K7_02955 [Symbiopectobacterium sp.]
MACLRCGLRVYILYSALHISYDAAQSLLSSPGCHYGNRVKKAAGLFALILGWPGTMAGQGMYGAHQLHTQVLQGRPVLFNCIWNWSIWNWKRMIRCCWFWHMRLRAVWMCQLVFL